MTDIRDHSKKIQIIYIPGKPPTILFGPQILWKGVPGPEQPVDTAPRELLLIKLTLWWLLSPFALIFQFFDHSADPILIRNLLVNTGLSLFENQFNATDNDIKIIKIIDF